MDIGVPELLIILAILIILFGPSKLAGVGRSLGAAIRNFRHELHDDAEASSAGDNKQL